MYNEFKAIMYKKAQLLLGDRTSVDEKRRAAGLPQQQTARRESQPKIAEMDVEMTT